jgi:hypothetical protein
MAQYLAAVYLPDDYGQSLGTMQCPADAGPGAPGLEARRGNRVAVTTPSGSRLRFPLHACGRCPLAADKLLIIVPAQNSSRSGSKLTSSGEPAYLESAWHFFAI